MSTASTKSSARKRARAKAGHSPGSYSAITEASRDASSTPEISERVWWIASIGLMLVAAFLRLYDYGLKPLHHDEGVNGFFLIRLHKEHIFQYDPANYHGPTLYYLSLPFTYLFGLNTFTIRFVPALFGIATVWLVLLLRPRIGAVGALVAATLISVSPGAVYLSRYYIHESLFVFLTLAIVVAALRYYDTTNPLYLELAAVAAALLFATKETAMISVGVFIIAIVSAHVYHLLRGGQQNVESWGARGSSQGKKKKKNAPEELPRQRGWARFGEPQDILLYLFGALALFVFLHIVFYSSFFTNAKGVSASLETFKIWTRTGTKDHVKEWYTYLLWLWQEEAPLLLLGAAGTLVAVWRAENRFTVFAALWSIGIIAAYSLVPYKTPWLALNFIIPLAIMGGYAVGSLYRLTNDLGLRMAAMTLAAVAVAVCTFQMVRLNFKHYDDDNYPYVYAHTRREFLPLVTDINRAAKRAGTGNQTKISVVAPEYWPLPWYLRDYKSVGYHGRVVGVSEPVIVCTETQEPEMQALLAGNYVRVNSYNLRPGVNLVLYVRRDLMAR